jgi:hypothetical protein
MRTNAYTPAGAQTRACWTMPAMFVAAATLLSPLLTAMGQPTIADQQLTLKDAGAFAVEVDIEAPQSIVPEFRQIRWKPIVRERLKGHGIEVPNSEAPLEGEPYLYVHVNAMQFEGGLVPFSVDVRFYQEALIGPSMKIRAMAAIWDSGAVGLVSSDQIHLVIASLEALVDEFAGDYLVANP